MPLALRRTGNIIKRFTVCLLIILVFGVCPPAFGAIEQRVVTVPTRPEVTQRFLYLRPEHPKAAVILLAGGHGGLQIGEDGRLGWGNGNFLVRTRQLFAEKNLAVAVIDAPSDRQNPPFLNGFRQRSEHAADLKAVIAWLKKDASVPVWLVGTSRGTQSAAYAATQLGPKDGGPDGLVLTSTILTDPRTLAVPEMPLEKITIPALIVHHRQDGCSHCNYDDLPRIIKKITAASRKELLSYEGGTSQGDPCEARAYHGFHGIEEKVVADIADWIIRK